MVTQKKPVFYLNYVTEYVTDFIASAGERYTVKLPRRKGEAYGEGISLTV